MTCLIHFTNTPLDSFLRASQKLEERGDPWGKFSALPYLWSNVWDLLVIVSFDLDVRVTRFVRVGVLETGR